MTSAALKHALDLALELPAEERAALAKDLLSSLDAAPDADASQSWGAEIATRLVELESGHAQTVSAKEALRRIDERLRGDAHGNPPEADQGLGTEAMNAVTMKPVLPRRALTSAEFPHLASDNGQGDPRE